MSDSPLLGRRPLLEVLLAAALFGASAPLAKLLLGEVEPIPLAALLYLGAGLGILLVRVLAKAPGPGRGRESRLDRKDLPRLAGAVLAGGVAAPLLLLYGLRATEAATASLLLNFEAVATAAIAAVLFRESVGQRTWVAILVVSLGSVLLSLDPSAGWAPSTGALLILAACAMWGLDNNLTREVSLKDPGEIVAVKGLVGGGVSLVLALALHRPFPGLEAIGLGLLLGSLCYGASISLFVRALRKLGSARTGALFAAAPFIGAAVSFVIFRTLPVASFFAALALMAVGACLLFFERHAHPHAHEPLEHAHSHRHDDGHHAHDHEGPLALAVEHAHSHAHEPVAHAHAHRPDAHHRHPHGQKARG
ncbi:MAG: EamA family transporter [Candidatus Bipolaricaulota bacterium]|nr:EamA family transporter [Candidatus Bipolaricaulota bacterium]